MMTRPVTSSRTPALTPKVLSKQHHREQQGAPDTRNIGLAARNRGAPDHHDRDRGEQIFVADIERGPAETARQQRAAQSAKRAAQRNLSVYRKSITLSATYD
jgi:hypothetical protein